MTPLSSKILAVLFLFSYPVLAQNAGWLSGQITDELSGNGIENAVITIANLQVRTDSEGVYTLIGIPAGSYSVSIMKDGYANLLIQDVMIGSAYSSKVNASLRTNEGYETPYESIEPIYSKIGPFAAFSADDIRGMPVRNLSEIVRTAPGVVAYDGFDELFVRGGNARELVYFLDGMRVSGNTGLMLPQTAIEQVTFEADPLSGQYGDAMSGIVHITTKTGMEKLYGSLEGFTSEALDPFGHTYLSGSVGGPLVKNKLALSISGEYSDLQDSDPRSVGELYVSDEILDNLRAAPTAFRGQLLDGTTQLLPIPATLTDGAQLLLDANGVPLVSNNAISFSDGTTINLDGVDATTLELNPVIRANFVEDFEVREAKRRCQQEHLSLFGSMTLQPVPGTRLRLGGRFNQGEQDDRTTRVERLVLFSPESIPTRETASYDLFGSLIQRVGTIGFIHLYGSYSDIQEEVFDARFDRDWDDLLEYGNIDNDVFSTLSGYRFLLNPPEYIGPFEDGVQPVTNEIHNLVSSPGGVFNAFSKSRRERIRFAADASLLIGSHKISFGAEFDRQTDRFFEIDAFRLARYVEDGDVELTFPDRQQGFETYNEFPLVLLEDFVGVRYGYDLRGQQEVEEDDINAFYSRDPNKPLESYNLAPNAPLFYGGYIEDTFTFSDLILHAGLRVDVFDANNRVLKDPFEIRPICRVADLQTNEACRSNSETIPSSIMDDFAVYYSGNTIIGYRDTSGNYFDSTGQSVTLDRILLAGQIRVLGPFPTEDAFKLYKPRVTLLPRLGIKFVVSTNASLFTRFGMSSQRPFFENVMTLQRLGPNQDRAPLTKTFIEMGGQYHHKRIGTFSLSGFFNNVEEGSISTTKGIELQFTSKRTNGFSAYFDYTFSTATGQFREEDFPLDIDQRHTMNLLLDYQLGKNEGPRLGSLYLLENLGVNVRVRGGSGFPYTPLMSPTNHSVVRPVIPAAEINSLRTPWSARVDLQIERRFSLSATASASAFIWIQNVFDQTNINRVWAFTGEHNDDGYLSTAIGQDFLANRQAGAEAVYNHLSRTTSHVGIPRLIRAGLRIDF